MKCNVCNVHCEYAGFQFNIIQNYILGFYSIKVGTLWTVLYFYCNWQISAQKTRKWEGMGVILLGVERDGIFPQVFHGIEMGREIFFVGVGREMFENPIL